MDDYVKIFGSTISRERIIQRHAVAMSHWLFLVGHFGRVDATRRHLKAQKELISRCRPNVHGAGIQAKGVG